MSIKRLLKANKTFASGACAADLGNIISLGGLKSFAIKIKTRLL